VHAAAWSLLLLCQICAKKLTFDVRGEWESVISKSLKILLNFNLDGFQTQLFIVGFVMNILNINICLLTFVIQFTTSMLENADIDWSQSMRATMILLAEPQVVFEFITRSNRAFTIEMTNKRNEQIPSIIVMDEKHKLIADYGSRADGADLLMRTRGKSPTFQLVAAMIHFLTDAMNDLSDFSDEFGESVGVTEFGIPLEICLMRCHLVM
jgi:hypothetical protein